MCKNQSSTNKSEVEEEKNMKKSMKGEVVLSACQVQAARLNKLEHRRLQRDIRFLRSDLNDHLARMRRQAQGLRYHYTNVVRILKPNRAYQLWKQAHAADFAHDEANEWLESIKMMRERNTDRHAQLPPVSTELPAEQPRPLLLLLGDVQKTNDNLLFTNENFLRPQTTPANIRWNAQRRVNPLLNMLDGRQPVPSANQLQQQQLESPSFASFSSMGTTNTRKLVQGKLVLNHKAANLDALYRMALQNQTAYRSVEQNRIEERKLIDKEFASQHRALKGTMRSSGLVK